MVLVSSSNPAEGVNHPKAQVASVLEGCLMFSESQEYTTDRYTANCLTLKVRFCSCVQVTGLRADKA